VRFLPAFTHMPAHSSQLAAQSSWLTAIFTTRYSSLSAHSSSSQHTAHVSLLALFTTHYSPLSAQSSHPSHFSLLRALFTTLHSPPTALSSQLTAHCFIHNSLLTAVCSFLTLITISYTRVAGLLSPGTRGLQGCFRTGMAHDYCGRSHAQQATDSIAAPHGGCHVCQLEGCDEPVFYEESIDRVHEYCSRFHADQALAQGDRAPSNRSTQGVSGAMQCSLPGCSALRWTDPGTATTTADEHTQSSRSRWDLLPLLPTCMDRWVVLCCFQCSCCVMWRGVVC
jgi:hypothetical protein